MTPSRTTPRARAKKTRPHASEISPGVFVGAWKDAEQFQGSRVCVLDERPSELDELPGADHVPIYDEKTDGPILANLDRVADLMHRAHDRGEPVLVFCGHGIRRGSLGGAWYLHRYEGLPLEKAFDRVASVRPKIERPQQWMGGWRQLDNGGAAPQRGRGRRDA
jgi:hypothetical protein